MPTSSISSKYIDTYKRVNSKNIKKNLLSNNQKNSNNLNLNKNQFLLSNFKTLSLSKNVKSRNQTIENEEMEEWNIYDDPTETESSGNSQFDYKEFKYYKDEYENNKKSNF